MGAVRQSNMGTKLWTLLVIVAAMTSVTTQIDLSSMTSMMGFNKKEEAKVKVPQQDEYNQEYGQEYGHNNQGHMKKPDKFGHIGGDHFSKFENAKQDHFSKFEKEKNKFFKQDKSNQTNYSQNYSPISVASPVEYPTYSNYDSHQVDDGTYTGHYGQQYGRPAYGQQYGRPAYGQQYGAQYRTPVIGPAQRPYPQTNYAQPSTPVLGPPPIRPPPSQYGSPPQYGNAPQYASYGAQQYPGYQQSGGYGPPQVVPQEVGYHEMAMPYNGPSLDSYNHPYGQAVDYSTYVKPIQYSEVSDYMSPAQYNDYTGMLYSAYNLPSPGPQQYSLNYTTNRNNNYNKEQFKMIVAVVVVSGYNSGYSSSHNPGYTSGHNSGYNEPKSFKDNSKDHGLGKDAFGKAGFGKEQASKKDDNNMIQGTLFISEIYPYVALVSGVITGMPANYRFGIAIHSYGDLTNGCYSIGGHYNPTNRTHGNINAPHSHVGDLGNLKSDMAGVAFVNKISRNQFSIQNNNPVAGRSIGICDKEDDLGLGGTIHSMRDGSCSRIMACGIIGLANTHMPASNSGHNYY